MVREKVLIIDCFLSLYKLIGKNLCIQKSKWYSNSQEKRKGQ